jgi:NitT/TauT family transport system ATP-binding protein
MRMESDSLKSGADDVHILVKDLKHYYANTKNNAVLVLDIPELVIRKEEFFCLVGPSGSGKSSLLNILTGFIRPDSGTVLIHNQPVTSPNPKFVQVFQDYALFPWRNVASNIAFGLEIKGLAGTERKEIVKHFIDLVGLEGFQNHYPHQLSGGMKQRVAIARALAVDPEIIFMDEPFGALDALTRVKMQIEVSKIAAATRKTIVFVTHSVQEAVYLGDRVAVLSALPGRIKFMADVKCAKPRERLDQELVALERSIYNELGL